MRNRNYPDKKKKKKKKKKKTTMGCVRETPQIKMKPAWDV